jgi:hypothetical protein
MSRSLTFPQACFLIGYLFGDLFLTIYDLACSALLQCMLVDEEVCGKVGNQPGKHRPAGFEKFFKDFRPVNDAARK